VEIHNRIIIDGDESSRLPRGDWAGGFQPAEVELWLQEKAQENAHASKEP
jgi:hypothetical protein